MAIQGAVTDYNKYTVTPKNRVSGNQKNFIGAGGVFEVNDHPDDPSGSIETDGKR